MWICHERMADVYLSSFSIQIVDFLDVIDDDILGYTPPAVITVLHTHLATCAVDYRYCSNTECLVKSDKYSLLFLSTFFVFSPSRPLYLPLRVLFTAESFSLSSNIIVDTATFHLRYW